MIFIVESGSTKSDWVLLDGKNNQSFYSTMGFNPYFHSSELIEHELKRNSPMMLLALEITEVYFYGAGCSSQKMNLIVKKALTKVFPNAVIHVDHDLVACAYSTYLGRPGISCIIGTGSNSCYFDGNKVSEVVPALGYILGDEGSGSYFGKKLLAAFLYHRLPSHLSADFEEMYGLDKEAIVDKIYCEPNANVFIASFMPFIAKHSDEPFFQTMIEAGFKHFMEVHVCCYSNYNSVDIHFVGSLASIFRSALDRAAASLGISVTSVVRKPVEGLVNYHLRYILKDKITQR
jgi:N-acetylglucosamine kinase-like BadF-type ATPase